MKLEMVKNQAVTVAEARGHTEMADFLQAAVTLIRSGVTVVIGPSDRPAAGQTESTEAK